MIAQGRLPPLERGCSKSRPIPGYSQRWLGQLPARAGGDGALPARAACGRARPSRRSWTPGLTACAGRCTIKSKLLIKISVMLYNSGMSNITATSYQAKIRVVGRGFDIPRHPYDTNVADYTSGVASSIGPNELIAIYGLHHGLVPSGQIRAILTKTRLEEAAAKPRSRKLRLFQGLAPLPGRQARKTGQKRKAAAMEIRAILSGRGGKYGR